MSKIDNPTRHVEYFRRADDAFKGEKLQVSPTKQIRISAFQTDAGKNMVDIRLWTMFTDSEGVYFPRKQGLCVSAHTVRELLPLLTAFINSPDVLELE